MSYVNVNTKNILPKYLFFERIIEMNLLNILICNIYRYNEAVKEEYMTIYRIFSIFENLSNADPNYCFTILKNFNVFYHFFNYIKNKKKRDDNSIYCTEIINIF